MTGRAPIPIASDEAVEMVLEGGLVVRLGGGVLEQWAQVKDSLDRHFEGWRQIAAGRPDTTARRLARVQARDVVRRATR